MKKKYEIPLLEIHPISDVIVLSGDGDGFENDPWSEGFGGVS